MCHQTLQIRIHLTAKHRHLSIWKLQSTGHWIAQAGIRFINVLAAPVAFFRFLRPWRFLWSYSLWKPIRFHPMPLRPSEWPPWFGGNTSWNVKRCWGDSTKFHWCTMWWNTLFDVVGLCNYSPFVARLVCRNQNGVSHDTRKQWKQHGPVQGQMWKSSAAQDSLYIYIISYCFLSPKNQLPFPRLVRHPIPVPDVTSLRKLSTSVRPGLPCGAAFQLCGHVHGGASRREKISTLPLYCLFHKEFCSDSL